MKIIFLSGAINFLGEVTDRRFWPVEQPSPVIRIRSRAADPFGGARGHDYIRLRGLAPKIGTLSHADDANCQCGPCVRERMLPAVLAICNRRQHGVPPGCTAWNDLTDESIHDLLDIPTVIGV